MGRKNYLVLHKREWDRINKWNHLEEVADDGRDEYYKLLVEKSQNWMKTWPDTAQSHMEKLAKENERKIKENKSFVNAFKKKTNSKDSLAEIMKARQIIFERSNYGRQLLSALYESKTLEERNVQIQFQAKCKQEAKTREEKLDTTETFLSKIDKQDTKTELNKKRQLAVDLANINYCMHKTKIIEEAKQKSGIVKEDLENAQLTQKLLESEAKQAKDYEEFLRRDIKEYEKQQQEWKPRRVAREKYEEARAVAQRKEKEERNSRIQQVMKELYKDKRDTEQYRNHYELIKKIEAEKDTLYENFLKAGIQRQADKVSNKEQEELLNEKQKREKCFTIAQENKKTAEAEQLCPCRIENKCVSDRQAIMCRSKGRQNNTSKETKESSTTFLQPTNKLLEALKQRQNEPSPWSGLQATHATFAEQAGNTLKECKHKIFARKVVDEYRKIYLLDAKTLPVENY